MIFEKRTFPYCESEGQSLVMSRGGDLRDPTHHTGSGLPGVLTWCLPLPCLRRPALAGCQMLVAEALSPERAHCDLPLTAVSAPLRQEASGPAWSRVRVPFSHCLSPLLRLQSDSWLNSL